MKLTSFKVIKLAVIVICMLAAGICYSCGVKNRDIGPENMVMALEPDGGTVVEESAGIESPRQRDEPEGGAGTMSAGADGEHLRGQDCMPGQEDVPSQAGRLSEGDMLPREDMPRILPVIPSMYAVWCVRRAYMDFPQAAGYMRPLRQREDSRKQRCRII